MPLTNRSPIVNQPLTNGKSHNSISFSQCGQSKIDPLCLYCLIGLMSLCLDGLLHNPCILK